MPAPLARLPRRVPGSIRRTAVIDIVADATLEGGHRLSGRACDVRTEANRSWPVADAVIAARVDAAAVLTDLSTPGLPALSGALRGRDARRGFRAAVAEALHAADAHASLEALMLDDLPGMSIISGYARLQRSPADAAAVRRPVIGTCSGWRTGGTAEVTADAGFVGLLDRPAAPSMTSMTGDVWWRDDSPPRAGTMRRRRLLDVVAGEATQVYGYFRDTYCEPTGAEVVVHEYEIRARACGDPAVLRGVAATPSALPFDECPLAAPNVSLLEGTALRDIDRAVRRTMAGVNGCTHLNDLVRILRFVEPLRDVVARQP